jgi:UDP-N-acetylglucosamine:LPS N-acetylglucosamine transferase
MLKRRIIALLEQHQPQLIISTHALLSYEITQVNEQLNKHIPLVYQLTDLEEVHKAWFIGKHAEAYLAPTREICEQAIRQDIEPERIHIMGRPVRQQFFNQPPSIRTEILKALGLDPNVFTIFLQGGAKGSAGLKQTVAGILTAEVPMQIILAIGNNSTLASRFAGIARLKVLPFTQAIAPYMAASDVIVGKAGASFLSEAFTLEKPCIITSIIPGQEAPSLRFIERHNLGWVCFEAEAQKQLLTTLASNPAMMAEKVASIQTYKVWNIQANQGVFPLITKVLQDQENISGKRDLIL